MERLGDDGPKDKAPVTEGHPPATGQPRTVPVERESGKREPGKREPGKSVLFDVVPLRPSESDPAASRTAQSQPAPFQSAPPFPTHTSPAHISPAAATPAPLNAAQLSLLEEASTDSLYSRSEVAKLFGLAESRLRAWEKSGFLQPEAEGRRARYRFSDLVEVRAAKGLLDQGIPLRRVRQALAALRQALPPGVRPLASCRILAEGAELVVRDGDGTYEPHTGQCLIEFTTAEISHAIVTQLRPPKPARLEQDAYQAYLDALRLEDSGEGANEAIEAAYRRALTYDPTFVSALTNLANHLLGQGQTAEALSLYHQALAQQPNHPETLFNLGLHYLDEGELVASAQAFQSATASAPAFADAHFNLAMVLEELNQSAQARPHWERYLELEPSGALAVVARRHLEELV